MFNELWVIYLCLRENYMYMNGKAELMNETILCTKFIINSSTFFCLFPFSPFLIFTSSYCACFRCPLRCATARGEPGPRGGGLSEALPTQSEGPSPDEHQASAVDRQCW